MSKETIQIATPKRLTEVIEAFSRLRLFGASLFPPLVFGSLVLGGYLVSYGILDESRRFLLQPPQSTNGF